MAKINWNDISAEDVKKAIRIFDEENPEHPEPRSTFLLYQGKKYPAKHIRGMSYHVHFGHEISKEDYSGGQETIRFFQRLGFETQHTGHPTHLDQLKTEEKKEENAVSNSSPIQLREKKSQEPITRGSNKIGQKIAVPTKGVIEQKNALQLLLNKLLEGDLVCEKTFSWMKTPSAINGEYQNLYDNLVSYRGHRSFAKRNVALRCDFVCESRKLIIEYDERQHFSEARRLSLLSYMDVPTSYDRDLWIRACNDIQAKDNQPEDRDEIRAYYDSTRDIEAAKHGYTLIRIMHGQTDFLEHDADRKLAEILGLSETKSNEPAERKSLKIGLYLQTNDVCNIKDFDSAMATVKQSDIDILVLPEIAYTPFEEYMRSCDFLDTCDIDKLTEKALDLSESIGRAVVFCNEDRFGTIMSIFANAYAEPEKETVYKDYIKHTATRFSAFEIENYEQYSQEAFEPILYKGFKIGLTICYDCNHSLFSRKYGLNGVDIILNSTGGNVVYDKWYKYNKARAIENHCFTFTTMGGPEGENQHNYVFGFTPEGKEMIPTLLNNQYDGRKNIPGGIYVYNTSDNDDSTEEDPSIHQAETLNKLQDLFVPVSGIDEYIHDWTSPAENLKIHKHESNHIVMCIVNNDDIMKPEKVLRLLYHKALRKYANKKYIVINRWDHVDMEFYRTKLSLILKVRAMENYCAVILSSPELNKCFQCGKTRNAQVVSADNGHFGIDLERAGGPETIWKTKKGMKTSWRTNAEWLIDSLPD